MRKAIVPIIVVFILIGNPLGIFGGMDTIRPPESSGEKYALVIGNNNYADLPKLVGPCTEAAAISESLEKDGFEVNLLNNATSSEMMKAIGDFAAKLRAEPSSLGFFWFSGHGVQLDYMGFLLGTDARGTAGQLRTGGVSLGYLFGSLNTMSNTCVVMVDASFMPLSNSAEKEVSLESALLEQLLGDIYYIRSTSCGEYASDESPFFLPVMKYLSTLCTTEKEKAFLLITAETMLASNSTQKPLFYIPRNFNILYSSR